jgi:hypothetical protein
VLAVCLLLFQITVAPRYFSGFAINFSFSTGTDHEVEGDTRKEVVATLRTAFQGNPLFARDPDHEGHWKLTPWFGGDESDEELEPAVPLSVGISEAIESFGGNCVSVEYILSYLTEVGGCCLLVTLCGSLFNSLAINSFYVFACCPLLFVCCKPIFTHLE